MARNFELDGETINSHHFGEAWDRVLYAINAVRAAHYMTAYAGMYPHTWSWGDPSKFHDAVLARLDGQKNSNGWFESALEYGTFLDRLEAVVLPAIEAAEAEMRQRKMWWEHAQVMPTAEAAAEPAGG